MKPIAVYLAESLENLVYDDDFLLIHNAADELRRLDADNKELRLKLAEQQAQQEPVLKIYKGELCYKSKDDDQSFGMWCPVTQDLPFPEGTKFYTTPQAQPAPEIAIADAYRAGVDSGIAAEREACAKVVEDFARKWWKIHCDSNKHLETTLKAHQDFCALQAAIRARGNT